MFGVFKAAKQKLQQEKLAQMELAYEKLHQEKQAQIELKVAFDAIGINVMKVNPFIQSALLKEALATSTKETMAHFIAALDAIKTSSASDDIKKRRLRDFYAHRAKQFSD
jgi:hypothetical protein